MSGGGRGGCAPRLGGSTEMAACEFLLTCYSKEALRPPELLGSGHAQQG